MISEKVASMYKHIYSKCYIRKYECTFDNRLKYLFVRKNGENSNKLLIVFSAFTGETPRYNYFYSFKDLDISQLYILDNFGYKGSYYLYENGSDYPERLTISLIETIKEKYKFDALITAGTSKGGTAALYFGLKLHSEHIFSGACQYFIGSYLNRDKHHKILVEMLGENYDPKMIDLLNSKVKEQIFLNRTNHGLIHLLYSKNELTYERQITHLQYELDKNNYQYEQRIETFEDHSTVGTYFIQYFIEWVEKNN